MFNKKGVSEIIITVIMVGLVLVAIGVVWYVINNVIGGQTGNINTAEKCLGVSLNVVGANCTGLTPNTCRVLVKRNAGGDSFTGLKIVFYTQDGTSSTIDFSGDIAPLQTINRTVADAPANAKKVELTPYFNDASGIPQVCSQTVSSDIA